MTLDLSQYLVEKKEEEEITPVSPEREVAATPIDITQYRVKEEPTRLQEFGRHLGRVGARAAETVIGFPGDIVQFVKFLGEKLPQPPKFLEREPTFVQEKGRELVEKLPTSEELKEVSSYLTSGFTDPQSAMEEFGDEITSLATALIIPSKDPKKFKTVLKALGQATAAKGVRKGAEKLGAGEKTKAAAEIGTLFLTGLLGKGSASKFVSDQYEKAHKMIPERTMLNTSKLAADLGKVEAELAKGISTATKNEVMGAVKQLKSKASGGAMPAKEVVEAYHNINERMLAKKLFDELNKTERKLLKNRYDLVKTEVNKTISEYGKNNPEFFETWKNANQAYATVAQSQGVKNFLQSKIKTIPGHLAAGAAIKLFLGAPTMVAAGAAVPVTLTGRMLLRVSRSPTLRKYYMGVINESLNENIIGVVKNLEKLESGLKKEVNRVSDDNK